MAADATRVQPAVDSGLPPTHKPSIAEHPRAARHVRQARQAAGLIGFLVAGWTSMATSTLAETLLRALIAGVVCQVVVWAAAVALFRHLILAELRSREHALVVAAKARAEAQERAQADIGSRGPVMQGGARS
ncbi:MAG: hypothetical protein WB698_01905 [Solirubrobacteraceae bacterium]